MTIDFLKLARLRNEQDAQLDKCRSLGERQRNATADARRHYGDAVKATPFESGKPFGQNSLSTADLLKNHADKFTPDRRASLHASVGASLRASNLAMELAKANAEWNAQGSFFLALNAYAEGFHHQ